MRICFLSLLPFASLLLVGAVSADVEGPRPTSMKSLEIQRLERQFFEREALEAYRDHGQRDPAWDQAVEKFLAGWIDWRVLPYAAPPADELLQLAGKAFEQGCRDPAFLYCRAALIEAERTPFEAALAMRPAYERLAGDKYDISFRCWAAKSLAANILKLGQPSDAKSYQQAVKKLLPQMAGDPNYTDEEQRLLLMYINSEFLGGAAFSEAEANWKEIKQAEMTPWLRDVLTGIVEVRRGFHFREVARNRRMTDEESEQQLATYLAAEDYLIAAWESDPSRPEAANWMLASVRNRGASREQIRLWFDRVVEAEIDHYPAYTQLRYYLQNSSDVSHDEMTTIGRDFLATGRFDTSVPCVFLEFALPTIPRVDQPYPPFDSPDVYAHLVEMARGYLDEESLAWTHSWMRSLLVAVAWRCRQWEDGAEFLKQMSPAELAHPEPSAFLRVGADIDESIGEIVARTGALAEQSAAADALIEEQKYAAAVKVYEEMQQRSPEAPRVQAYVAHQIKVFQRKADFQAGKWVDLLPDEDLRGWQQDRGKWSVDKEGRLVGRSTEAGLLLTCNDDFGTDYELEGTTRFVHSNFSMFNAGVYFGAPSGRYKIMFPYKFYGEQSYRYYETENYAVFMQRRKEQKKKVEVKSENTFRVLRRGDRLTCSLNGVATHKNIALDVSGPPEEQRFAIGGYFWYPDAVIEFQRLRIRKAEGGE